jgi:hypothetical protein
MVGVVGFLAYRDKQASEEAERQQQPTSTVDAGAQAPPKK